MPRTIEVHSWDEISGEFSKNQVEVPLTADAGDIVNAWYASIDFTPDEDERRISITHIDDITLVAIKDTYGHQAMCWWGRKAEAMLGILRCKLDEAS